MKIIETNGITFLEHLAENSEWYCGTDYASGELYEAEEVFLKQGTVKPNRVIFLHHPDGELVEPIRLEENQYFGRPTQIDGSIYLLIADFGRKLIRILDCGSTFEEIKTVVEISLTEAEDCYNLILHGNPLMLTRQGGDHLFEVIWPEEISFPVGDTEAFLYKEGEKYVFSRWMEDPDYREEIVIRDKDGNLVDSLNGSIFITPSGEKWVLR